MSDIINVVVTEPPTETILVEVLDTDPTETITVVVSEGTLIPNELLDAHRAESSPHTVYDDMADLGIIFENGLI